MFMTTATVVRRGCERLKIDAWLPFHLLEVAATTAS